MSQYTDIHYLDVEGGGGEAGGTRIVINIVAVIESEGMVGFRGVVNAESVES